MKVKSKNVKGKNYLMIFGFCLAVLCGGAAARAQTGGTYAITQSVIASGGGQSSSRTLAVEGTIGQAVAGQPMSGAAYNIYGGFFTPTVFAPTAADVTISGRVLTASGGGIRNVIVTLTGADDSSRTILSGKFGVFHFANVAVGATYFISVSAKHYRFVQNTQIFSITQDLTDVTFVAAGDVSLPPSS